MNAFVTCKCWMFLEGVKTVPGEGDELLQKVVVGMVTRVHLSLGPPTVCISKSTLQRNRLSREGWGFRSPGPPRSKENCVLQ